MVRVKAFDYSAALRLASFNEIVVTDAEPQYAKAIAHAVEICGGRARIVRDITPGETVLLTEGLASEPPAGRHYATLEKLLATGKGRTFALDFLSSSLPGEIGGCAGLCRSVRIERAPCSAFALSLDKAAGPEANAMRIMHALFAPDDDYSLFADGGWRDEPGAELLPPSSSPIFRGNPVWLVTGGGRGVTADCAVELARRTGGTFLLVGRSHLSVWPDWLPLEADLKALRGQLARNSDRPDMPKKPVEIDRMARGLLASAEISATLNAIRQAGAHAVYLPADIGNPKEVRQALVEVQRTTGQITGLVHGAGVLSDGHAEALRANDFEKVFAPKVGGFESILSVLDTSALEHIGLFSSASAVFGNTGQANYAAANEWLNKLAEHLSHALPKAQVKSFCWGPWQGGMVDDALARMFTERGIGLISRPEGARIFADMLLNSPHEQVRFVIGDEWGGA